MKLSKLGMRSGWLLLGAILAPAALIGGCGGGNGGGLDGTTTSTQNGTFSGNLTGLETGRSGVFSLASFTDNHISGSLSVRTPAAAARAVSLPDGIYSFSGTRSGNDFTATGRFSGTPVFTFSVRGTVATTADDGSLTISGKISGHPFSFSGTINALGGGTGNTGPVVFNPAFSDNTSNANVNKFTPSASTGEFFLDGTTRTLSCDFLDSTDTNTLRRVSVSFTKKSALAVGDTLTVGSNGAVTGYIAYTETPSVNELKTWQATSGTARIVAISGKSVTLQISGAKMQPTVSPVGLFNGGTGTFMLDGKGSITSNAALS